MNKQTKSLFSILKSALAINYLSDFDSFALREIKRNKPIDYDRITGGESVFFHEEKWSRIKETKWSIVKQQMEEQKNLLLDKIALSVIQGDLETEYQGLFGSSQATKTFFAPDIDGEELILLIANVAQELIEYHSDIHYLHDGTVLLTPGIFSRIKGTCVEKGGMMGATVIKWPITPRNGEGVLILPSTETREVVLCYTDPSVVVEKKWQENRIMFGRDDDPIIPYDVVIGVSDIITKNDHSYGVLSSKEVSNVAE